VIVEELCVKVIDEVRGAEDAQTHYRTNEGTPDFMSTAAVSLTTQVHLMRVEITRREIQVWKNWTIPLPKTSNPLKEWYYNSVQARDDSVQQDIIHRVPRSHSSITRTRASTEHNPTQTESELKPERV